jgi:hypothetical protein
MSTKNTRTLNKRHSHHRSDLFIVFNATFSNISAISRRPVLVVEEAGENYRLGGGGFLRLLQFPPPIKLTPRYN